MKFMMLIRIWLLMRLFLGLELKVWLQTQSAFIVGFLQPFLLDVFKKWRMRFTSKIVGDVALILFGG